MKHYLSVASQIFIALFPSAVFAQSLEVLLKRDGMIFSPSAEDCAARDICDLKQVVFRLEQYRLPPADEENDMDLLGTKLYASYETARIDQLEKYVFVQFIHGCGFYRKMKNDGAVNEYLGLARLAIAGGRMIFRHPLWSIDSNGPDPVYSANKEFSGYRHYLAEWEAEVPEWVPYKQGNLYGEDMPTVPRLFMTDMPSPAWYRSDGWSQNVSFEFRTCLYKTSDVPKEIYDEHDEHFADPVVCWSWKHRFVYNYILKRFDQPETTDPTCVRPLTPKEEEIDKALREQKKSADAVIPSSEEK